MRGAPAGAAIRSLFVTGRIRAANFRRLSGKPIAARPYVSAAVSTAKTAHSVMERIKPCDVLALPPISARKPLNSQGM